MQDDMAASQTELGSALTRVPLRLTVISLGNA
jgi:hypothetical protein